MTSEFGQSGVISREYADALARVRAIEAAREQTSDPDGSIDEILVSPPTLRDSLGGLVALASATAWEGRKFLFSKIRGIFSDQYVNLP